jgi:hypothetical protein
VPEKFYMSVGAISRPSQGIFPSIHRPRSIPFLHI